MIESKLEAQVDCDYQVELRKNAEILEELRKKAFVIRLQIKGVHDEARKRAIEKNKHSFPKT